MKFHYQAKQRDGANSNGTIESDSLATARNQLRRDGLFPLTITADPTEPINGLSATFSMGKKRIKPSDLMMMLSQINIMVQSGVDLAEAIKNVSTQTAHPRFRIILESVHDDISAGKSLSTALAKHPTVFNETFVAGIAAGEHSGNITDVLQRLTDLIRTDVKLRNTVTGMLMYPLVLCGVTFLVVNALIFFVLPQFAKVFEGLGKPAPPITQMMLDFGSFINAHIILVLGFLAILLSAFVAAWKTHTAKRLRDHMILKSAIVRDATQALLTGRSFRLLGTMLSSGVPLVEGIRLCQNASGNTLFKEMFIQIEHDVLRGEGLGKPLMASAFLPRGAAQMVSTAEHSGNLGNVLKDVGAYFEEDGERRIRDLVKIMEPAVIVLLGVIVAAVVLSVVMPLLDVSSSQR